MLVRALLATAASVAISPVVLLVLRRRNVLDYPSERSSHEQPTPRGGGVAPALAIVLVVTLLPFGTTSQRVALAVAASAFGLIGIIEDLHGIPALRRLLLGLLAASACLPWLLGTHSRSSAGQIVVSVTAVVAIVSYVNAYNFMDGINGISVAQAVVAGVAWSAIGASQDVEVLQYGGAVVAGAAIGFGPFNFPRARMFLGDVGSYFLGAWLATLVVVALQAGVPPEAVVAPLAVYLADTGTTLVRRILRREPWYLPHRDHTYQQLARAGWSHVTTVAVVTAFMVGCASLGAFTLDRSSPARAAAVVGLGILLAAYLALPWALAAVRRRASTTHPDVTDGLHDSR